MKLSLKNLRSIIREELSRLNENKLLFTTSIVHGGQDLDVEVEAEYTPARSERHPLVKTRHGMSFDAPEPSEHEEIQIVSVIDPMGRQIVDELTSDDQYWIEEKAREVASESQDNPNF